MLAYAKLRVAPQGNIAVQEGTRSRTAEAAAFQRAAHLMLDDSPFVFDDHEVTALLSPAARFFLKQPGGLARSLRRLRRTMTPELTQLRGQIVVRSRYTEERLQRQLENQLSQYVILSAGLDTFALRSDDSMKQLNVYEVDQQDTQRWKRQLLKGREPDNLNFIPVDFERQSIADALEQSTFNFSQPAFFSWLGTTYYLSREAIFSSLQSILSIAASGSELVLDYWSQPPSSNWRSNMLLNGVRFAVASQSEPMLSFFKPEEIERDVSDIDFEVVENFTPDDAREAYLEGRSDKLDVPDFGYLLHLRVP